MYAPQEPLLMHRSLVLHMTHERQEVLLCHVVSPY